MHILSSLLSTAAGSSFVCGKHPFCQQRALACKEDHARYYTMVDRCNISCPDLEKSWLTQILFSKTSAKFNAIRDQVDLSSGQWRSNYCPCVYSSVFFYEQRAFPWTHWRYLADLKFFTRAWLVHSIFLQKMKKYVACWKHLFAVANDKIHCKFLTVPQVFPKFFWFCWVSFSRVVCLWYV